MLSLERFIAWRYLRAKKEEGFVSTIAALSFLGIVLGVFSLILVTAVMNGFRTNLVQQILDLNGHLVIEADKTHGLPQDSQAIDAVRQHPNVARVLPLVEGQVLVRKYDEQASLNATQTRSDGAAQGATAMGFVSEDLFQSNRFFHSLRAFNFDSQDAAAFRGWNVLISYQLARGLGVSAGDKIQLISTLGHETPLGWTPRQKVVHVSGYVESQQGTPLVLMPFDKAQILFKLKGQVSRLDLSLHQVDDLLETADSLKQSLGEKVRLLTWRDLNRAFVAAWDIERIVVAIILSLVVLVAAFNIIAGQTMLVQEKGKGIAVMRTMGAKRALVARVFLISGTTIGLLATMIGATLGFVATVFFQQVVEALRAVLGPESALSSELAWLGLMKPELGAGWFFGVCLFSLALSFLAALYPAWRAASYEPVEALRYE